MELRIWSEPRHYHYSSYLKLNIFLNIENEDNEYYDITIEVAHIKLSNISPETFQIILRYLYVKGTDEILGGYNPSIWKNCDGCGRPGWGQSYYSFIFSYKNKDVINDLILSRIKNIDKALCYYRYHGPTFGGSDLKLYCSAYGNEHPFDSNVCKQTDYEKRIRDTEDKFYIEDYEVFQITKK
ncbi:hypothetical protein GLOIN_2v1882676 [Rhizophagus irregularis DAOM 181602=DAOM 197198]|nr:hypothetical protein GLOIN_2v1882676 [Rhizophagus irregularis DAOM 181602=DAOM 197198]